MLQRFRQARVIASPKGAAIHGSESAVTARAVDCRVASLLAMTCGLRCAVCGLGGGDRVFVIAKGLDRRFSVIASP